MSTKCRNGKHEKTEPGRCLECQRECYRRYNQKPERKAARRARQRAEYASDPDSRKKKCAEWKERNPDWQNAWARADYRKNPDKYKNKRLKIKYGITLADYDRMVRDQQGLCAICGCGDKLVVDHDHATGAVRKLLCHTCNAKLGSLEQADWVEAARRYLEEHANAY